MTERLPRYQAESLSAPERTDFWAKSSSGPSAPADLRPPSVPRAEEPTVTRASWASTAETAAPAAREPAPRIPAATAGTSGGTGTTLPLSQKALSQQPASPQSSPGQPAHAVRPDRYFPVRLLVVIVIAALIGSALVLLLK
jgi:hypothetical protein